MARLRNRRPRNGSSLPDTDIFLFFRDSRLSLGPIQFPNRRILPRGKVATRLHIAPTLRIRVVIPLLPHIPSWRGQGQLYHSNFCRSVLTFLVLFTNKRLVPMFSVRNLHELSTLRNILFRYRHTGASRPKQQSGY